MKKGGGKNKGNTFERDICKLLSEWAGGNGDTLFWRTASSGGRFTQHAKKGKGKAAGMDGDITAVDHRGRFFTDNHHVECKTYKEIDLLHTLDLPSGGQFMKFWLQAWEGSQKANKIPLLIFKRNFSQIYIASQQDASLGGGDVRITLSVPFIIPSTRGRIITSIDIRHIEDWLRDHPAKEMRDQYDA